MKVKEAYKHISLDLVVEKAETNEYWQKVEDFLTDVWEKEIDLLTDKQVNWIAKIEESLQDEL